MNPEISIIIPVYNVDSYIRRCIHSVIKQEFTNWEIIAVNDGSTDSSWTTLQSLANEDPRIFIIDKPNEGVVIAREYAIKKAIGKYLFFLDADDYLPQSALNSLYIQQQKTQADIIVGNYCLVWEESHIERKISKNKNFETAVDCLNYCLHNSETFLPIKLYKTDIYREHVKIPSEICIQEDTIGLSQYLNHSKTASFTEECIYYYFKRPGSASYKTNKNQHKSLLTVITLLNQIIDQDKQKTLKQAIDKVKINNLYSFLSTNGTPQSYPQLYDEVMKAIDWKNIHVSLKDKRLFIHCFISRLYTQSSIAGKFIIFFYELMNQILILIKRTIWKIGY